MNVVMIVPSENFNDDELEIPCSYCSQAGISVCIASSTKLPLKSQEGKERSSHLLFSQVEEKDFSAIIFVGGSGTRILWENPTVLKLAQKFWQSKKIVAGICYGAVIPFKAGLGKNFHATTYPDAVSEIQKNGGCFMSKDVVQDGHVITASGPHAASEFAQTVIHALKK
jgi:protease I